MSQGDTTRIYAGHDQVDVATLVADGIRYRCYVYIDRTQWTVEALFTRIQPDDTEVVLFSNTVFAATATALSNTQNIPLDSPKIIASGTTFVVHYLYADSVDAGGLRVFELFRATMDMEAFSTTTWTNRLDVALHTDALYDVQTVIGSPDYIITRKLDATHIRTERFDGFTWADTVWSTDTAVTIAGAVLGVYAHDADNDAIVSFQLTGGSANQLHSMRLEADTGNDSGPVRTFVDFPAANFLQVTHARTGSHEVAVIVEAQTLANVTAAGSFPNIGWIHHLAARHIDSSDATRSGYEHWAAHLHLCSRAWTYANGNGSAVDLYVLASFRGVDEPYEWVQATLFALNLDTALWGTIEETDTSTRNARTLHPRAIATMYTDGVPDARASGWKPVPTPIHIGGPTKRMNHLSNVVPANDVGPGCKAMAIASVVFARFGDLAAVDPYNSPNQVGTKEPERAGLCRRLVYMEDPSTLWRDTTSGTQPVDNFAGVNARSMLQTVPAGRSLVVGGGTPQTYDGRALVELGFLWKPEIIAFDFGSGGNLEDNGIYQWYAVYSWVDAAGQTHRSGIVLRPNALNLGMGNTAAQLRVRTMTISTKDHTAHYPGAAPIQIELFRTTSTGAIFYRVFGAAEGISFRPRDTPQNDPTVEWITITDDVDDATIIDQGLGPYQFDTNGVLVEPIPVTPPAMSVVATYANRAWGADSCDPSLVWYTDEVLPDLGSVFYLAPVFGGSQFFRVGEIGEITAMHAMNDVLIVFTSAAIFAIRAVDAGAGLLSCVLETLHTGTGCIEPRSVVEAPQGLFFQSAKGFFLLTRGRELDYLNAGASVEDEIRLAGNVRSATIHLDRNQLRIACNGRPAEIETWTFAVGVVGGAGTWTITGLSVPIEVVVPAAQTSAQVADLIAAEITANLVALQFEVASVSSPGTSVVVTLLEDVSLTLVGDAPGASSLGESLATSIRVRPRVLVYDYNAKLWSRADLVHTSASASERFSEVVDAVAWGGLGDSDAHVVATQGALLVERGPTDPDLYTDQTSTGDVGIPIDITTGWIHLAGIAGYKRVRSIGVQTIRIDDAAIAVTVEYDRDGSYQGQAILPDTYDWADPAPAYLRIRPRVQKVAAVRLRIYEATGVANRENLRVVALTFDVGRKPGLRRVSDAQIGS